MKRAPINAAPKRPFTVLHSAAPSSAGNVTLAACGAKPYLFIDQNIDPQAKLNGKIDAAKIIAAITAKYGTDPVGFGMLDYENPFDYWIGMGPGTKEHAYATKQMVEAIMAVNFAFPKVRWTYYGIPGLGYWPNGRLWATANLGEQISEKNRQLANYGPVLNACDWYTPCLYDVQRNDTQRPQDVAINEANEVDYRHDRIDVCAMHRKQLQRHSRPIIPAVCPLYDTGGNVSELRLIPESEFLSDQVRPCIDHADGVCIWAATGWMVRAATSTTDSPERAKMRAFFDENVPGVTWDATDTPATLNDWCSTMLASRAAAIVAAHKSQGNKTA